MESSLWLVLMVVTRGCWNVIKWIVSRQIYLEENEVLLLRQKSWLTFMRTLPKRLWWSTLDIHLFWLGSPWVQGKWLPHTVCLSYSCVEVLVRCLRIFMVMSFLETASDWTWAKVVLAVSWKSMVVDLIQNRLRLVTLVFFFSKQPFFGLISSVNIILHVVVMKEWITSDAYIWRNIDNVHWQSNYEK